MDPNLDILVLSALTEEQQVINAVLEQTSTRLSDWGDFPARVPLYEYCTADNAKYLLGTACAHDMGSVSMGALATALFNADVRPNCAVLIGIAATLKPEDADLSDVPVASEIFSADNIRVENKFQFRQRSFLVDPIMKSVAGGVRADAKKYELWRRRCVEIIRAAVTSLNSAGFRNSEIIVPQEIKRPRLLMEIGGGGPFLIADPNFRDALYKGSDQVERLHPKAAWFEMEAPGFMNAAHNAHVPAMVIKGISDRGDPEKAHLEKETGGFFRAYACSNAVLALLHILNERPRPPISPSKRLATTRTATMKTDQRRPLAVLALGIILVAVVSYAWYLHSRLHNTEVKLKSTEARLRLIDETDPKQDLTYQPPQSFATAMTSVASTGNDWNTVRILANTTGTFSDSFDQHNELKADTVRIIIREITFKDKSKDNNLRDLESDVKSAISRWKKLYDERRIKELCIQRGSYYPYYYYATFDDKVLLSGLFVPNNTIYTQSDVQNAQVAIARTRLGQREIERYQKHFDCFSSYITQTKGSSANVSPSTCPHGLTEGQLPPAKCGRDSN